MRNNDHMQHPRGQQNRRGPGQGGQRGHQDAGRRPNSHQGGPQRYFNPDQNWGARGYGGGGGDQGVEDWERRDEEMDRGQYTAPLGHGDDTDWHDDDAFGGEFIGDEPNRFGGQNEGRYGGMSGAGYGTHGGAQGGQWGSQGNRGYGGQGMGGGPGGYYGQGPGMNQGYGRDSGYGRDAQGYGQRQGGSIGGPSSGGMGWRGEQGWQGNQTRSWDQQPNQQRFERGPKGYKRSDDRIKEDVSDRISQLQHVDSSDVEVEVKEGEVTLTGTVPNRVMKWQLENLVESIGGVTDVNNMLRIRREGGFMQQARSTMQSAVNALKPDDTQDQNKNTPNTEHPNARRGGTTGSQDTGLVTNKK